MRVAIRADASAQIGIGHVMRCLTLAQGLSARGANVSLLSRGLSDDLNDNVARAKCERYDLPKPVNYLPNWLGVAWQDDVASCASILGADSPVDWLVVDHYGIDFEWEQQMRPYARRILVIDDLADRRHVADVLLDPNYPDDAIERYQEKLPPTCHILSGTRYVLLRDEFVRAHLALDNVDRARLLIQFGGADPADYTAFTIHALAPWLAEGVPCDVVVGGAYARLNDLRILLDKYRFPEVHLHVSTIEMASLMRNARLAVAGGGTSTWERCCMGLPAVVMAIAENQFKPLVRLHETGAVYNLGYANAIVPDQLLREVKALWYDNARRANMEERGRCLVDGQGLQRVLEVMNAL